MEERGTINWKTTKDTIVAIQEIAPGFTETNCLIGGSAAWFYKTLLQEKTDPDFPAEVCTQEEESAWYSKNVDVIGTKRSDLPAELQNPPEGNPPCGKENKNFVNIPTQLRALAKGLGAIHARMASKKEGRSWKTWGTIALCAVLVASFAQMGPQTGQEATLTAPTQVPILEDGKQVGSATLPVGAKVSILKEDRPSGKVLIKANLGQAWVSARNVGFDWGVEEPLERAMDPAKVAATTSSPKRKTPSVKEITLKYGHQYWEKDSTGTPTKLVMMDEGTVVEPIAEEAGEFLYLYKGHELWTTRDGQYKHPPSGPTITEIYRGVPIRLAYGLRASAKDIWEAVKKKEILGEGIRKMGELVKEDVEMRCQTRVIVPHEIMEEKEFVERVETVSLRPLIEELGIKVERQDPKQPLDVCALFAVAKALEFEAKKNKIDFKPSMADLNYLERKEGAAKQCGGATKTNGLSMVSLIITLCRHGVMNEKSWPHGQIGKMPPTNGVREKWNITLRTLTGFSELLLFTQGQWDWETNRTLQASLIREEIRAGRVVIGGIHVGKNTVLDSGKRKESHALLIVGYTTKARKRNDGTHLETSYEVMNSWGDYWGNNGYGTITKDGLFSELWSISLSD